MDCFGKKVPSTVVFLAFVNSTNQKSLVLANCELENLGYLFTLGNYKISPKIKKIIHAMATESGISMKQEAMTKAYNW